ncbi:uncharacterized protein LOC103060173 [Python bivittatus]|uniref:Uncharacterized protein LOC103060173 n=1 Tax=Python bivittatus TaxID=176946 RepID=A0A9F2R6I5_PYTBI|nr:uncharacterized protein LOC103060173 [Python bivittatus]
MAAGLLAGLGSERKLARSVAHRLKYYIEVQRKENSFQSSGIPWDVAESFYLHPAYLTEHRTQEHNFAKIKLEAFLRAYVGSAEECNRKIQGSLAKQKDVEKLIKKMARDYVPDRMNEVKMKSMTRQNKLPCSLSRLYLNAVPPMSPEEVKRLVSSASKLIVAVTSEISPEELKTTQELKRRETKSVKSFSNGRKEVFSTNLSHENEARRDGPRQSEKEIRRKNRASNASNTSPAKSKRIFPMAAWNTQKQHFVPSLQSAENVGVHSYMPLKIRRQESSSKAGGNVSSEYCPSKKPLAARRSQTLRSKAYEDGLQRPVVLKTKEQQGNCAHPSARSTAEIYSSQHSKAGKKIRKPFSSEMISRSSILKRASDPKHNQNDPREKLLKCTQSNRSPKGEWEGCDSLSQITSKCHKVNFADWEPLGLQRANVRGSDDDATVSYTEKSRGLTGCIRGGQNSDCISTVQQGPSFLHELCQEVTQEIPADRTRKELIIVNGNAENPQMHYLLNQPSSLSEPRDTSAEEDHVNSPRRQEGMLEESCKQEVICVPPMAPAGCRCSELPSYCVCEIKEEQGIGFPGKTAALSKSLDSEQSKDEFTISSLSSSARSLSSLCEQMGENIIQKESVNSRMEMFLQKLLKAPENGTTQQEVSHQHEKQM